MKTVDFYFDFVSPYSYICLHRLQVFPNPIIYKPVLFAGLLNHWGQKGPAEIPAKRLWTYRWCTWWAKELGIPFRFPALHPFNPLQHLRLCIAAGSTRHAVEHIFDDIWTMGSDPTDPARFSALLEKLKIDEKQLGEQRVKHQLRAGTEEAVRQGVFGVPSFVVDGEVFWGADSIGFLQAFLDDSSLFKREEMQRLERLPIGAARRA